MSIYLFPQQNLMNTLHKLILSIFVFPFETMFALCKNFETIIRNSK